MIEKLVREIKAETFLLKQNKTPSIFQESVLSRISPSSEFRGYSI